MPNWVQNEIIFENASDEKVAALIRELKLATESDERAFDFNKIIRRYPDGWVQGRVTFLPPTTRKIEIALCDWPARYLNLNRGDIYDVAYEKPKEA